MKHIKTALLGFGIMTALVMPMAFAHAQPTSGATGTSDPKSQSFQLVPCSGVATAEGGKDCDFAQLLVLFQRVINFLLYLSVPLVLAMIMYTAFKFLTANGDPGKLVKAKQMLVPVAIGLFWVLGAYIVVYTVLDNLLADQVGGKAKEDVIFLNDTGLTPN